MLLELGHPLRRDGTSQRQRPLPALLPENNPVDARTVEDGLIYAYELAEQITFYDPQNQRDGNWQAFFPGTTPEVLSALLEERKEQEACNVPPQQALFITFLRLLELLKKDLNSLTKKHLNFYYEEVLGFKRKKAQPDRVHVLFQVAKQISRERLKADTTLLAGKDQQKKPLLYRLIDEIVINSAKVKTVRSYEDRVLGDSPRPNRFEEHSVPSEAPFSPFGERTGANVGSNLLIGIENFLPESQLSLLFQMVEGSAPDSTGLEQDDIHWYYWSADSWWRIPPQQVLRNTTINLQQPGIITFSFAGILQPSPMNFSDLGIPGLFWIRARTTKHPDLAPRMIDIQAQAVVAEFVDHKNDARHLEQPLEPKKVKSLQNRNPNVRKVEQPYQSFRGVPKEKDRSFFARVSEKLRHKNRAVTIWDYEHLVLVKFEEIYKVKAISHTGRNRLEEYSEFRPGEVLVVVIPKITDLENQNALRPQASNALLRRIKHYLQLRHTPVITLRVSNPKYETIQLEFKVGFREGFDGGFYRGVLNEDIRRHLSPWAYEIGEDITFGGRIYRSQLLAFVERLEYVDYVTDFVLYYHGEQGAVATEVASASTEASILISAEEHDITVLAPGEYPCDESVLCEDGIGCMIVNLDFRIGKNL